MQLSDKAKHKNIEPGLRDILTKAPDAQSCIDKVLVSFNAVPASDQQQEALVTKQFMDICQRGGTVRQNLPDDRPGNLLQGDHWAVGKNP
jgi:hypothetical protein